MKIFEDFLSDTISYPEYKVGTILYTEDFDETEDKSFIQFYQIVKRNKDYLYIKRIQSKIVSKQNSQGRVLVKPMKDKFIDSKPFIDTLPYLVIQRKYKKNLPIHLWDGGSLDTDV